MYASELSFREMVHMSLLALVPLRNPGYDIPEIESARYCACSHCTELGGDDSIG